MVISEKRFREFLQALANSGVVRVVGSYATGMANTEDHISDLDLWVLREDKGMKKVISIFDKFGVPWESLSIGYINSPRDVMALPFPVECSYLFKCKRGRTEAVEIEGVTFLAYVQ
jgi:predicted nucleotidyltransferase